MLDRIAEDYLLSETLSTREMVSVVPNKEQQARAVTGTTSADQVCGMARDRMPVSSKNAATH